jgi:hypothetical protein
MQFFAFEKLAHSVHPVRSERANGTRFSRREASAASEAVGWKRMLCRLSFVNNDVDYTSGFFSQYSLTRLK